MSEQTGLNEPVEASMPKRGLVRLILGTFFVVGAFPMLVLSVGAGSSDLLIMVLIYGALGLWLTWWGAHDKAGWERPLGICWIVGGLSLAGNYIGQISRLPERPALPGSGLFLAGAVIMAIVGGFLVFAGRKLPETPSEYSATRNRFLS